MFIITAKLDKRKLLIAALIALVVVVAAVLIFSGGDSAEAASLSAVVKSNEQRVNYLKSFGWEVGDEPMEEQSVTIPREFKGAYSDYQELQRSQGFDLAKYSGLEATRYTYEVKNHPRATSNVVADIIVYRNEVIAGDIQCVSADGFMEGLKFPKT